jgi:hypothetical protein
VASEQSIDGGSWDSLSDSCFIGFADRPDHKGLAFACLSKEGLEELSFLLDCHVLAPSAASLPRRAGSSGTLATELSLEPADTCLGAADGHSCSDQIETK